MKAAPELPIESRVGGALDSLKIKPLTPYSEPAVVFLAELSKKILGMPTIRSFPDVAAFGYWCRAANLARMAREFDQANKRIGRGLVLHIAPGNVPVNFAFSLAFGVLSGNANIVRMPEAKFPQSEFLCDAIAELFSHPEHAEIASRNRILRYARSDETTAALSATCQARVIWGGDKTVKSIRSLPAPSRCVDITFADRYSFCAIGAKAVLNADAESLRNLATGFYNDAYLMDQNACSSPHLVVWIGQEPEVLDAMDKFWSSVAKVVSERYPFQPIHAVDKILQASRSAIEFPGELDFSKLENLIYRIRLPELNQDTENLRGQFGLFYEFAANDLNWLTRIVSERCQTLAIFGLDQQKIVDEIIKNGLLGIDRIVPIGKALDIGVIWDGYDVIASLSRTIGIY